MVGRLVVAVLAILALSAAPAHATLAFGPSAPLPGGASADLEVGDLDGDGLTDLAAVAGSDVVVMRGLGDGTFAPDTLSFGQPVNDLALGDLNRDGRPDLFATSTTADDLRFRLSQPGGGFGALRVETGLIPDANHNVVGLTIADLSGDGIVDAAVTDSGSFAAPANAAVRVLIGTDGSDFGAPTAVAAPSGSQPSRVSAADADGDGDLDLVTGRSFSTLGGETTIGVMRNNGGGSFSSGTAQPGAGNAEDPQFADLGGDGRPEIVVGLGSSVVVLPNTSAVGTPSFGPAVSTATNTQRPRDVAIVDLDLDGDRDIWANSIDVPSAAILLNNGAGTLAPGVPHAVGADNARSIAAARFDGDGAPDLAVTISDEAGRVVLNAPLLSAGTVTAFAEQPQGTTSAPKAVTVTNDGEAPLRGAGTALTGEDFIVSANGCTGTVAPGASCTLAVRFAPTGPGARNGSLQVLGNAGSQTTIALSGTGGALPQGPPGDDGATGPQGAAGAQGAPAPRARKARPGHRERPDLRAPPRGCRASGAPRAASAAGACGSGARSAPPAARAPCCVSRAPAARSRARAAVSAAVARRCVHGAASAPGATGSSSRSAPRRSRRSSGSARAARPGPVWTASSALAGIVLIPLSASSSQPGSTAPPT